ncbi:endospore germination permease [Paenibacillus sp. SYP-B3998]|uniref:Endospore germination permease n=1 Tax=Paenibacillus sp. SYP-B3998 TaxID=2678564 RepID=A0A6G4A3U7_9BACL|nr:endospore germination permease [Paenibacillus sp. SYP-B3998]NEW09062.1 endospore germination permease [Paenibacillus sp. SYP-B3998]
MKKYKLNEITTMQYIFLIHGTQLGVGMLQLPRILAEMAGTDGWISILNSWIISTIVGLIVIQIMKKNPERTLPELLKHYFGKWASTVLTISFILFFTLTAIAELLRSILFVKVWLLPETPDYIILASFAIPGYMITCGGIRIIGRYAELAFFLTLGIPLLYLIPLKDGNWHYLLPLFKEGIEPVLLATLNTSYSFFGSEIAFLLYPMLQRKQYATIGMITGNTLTMVAYLLATLVCFIYFSPDEISRYNEPSVSVLKTIEFRFIQRLEILLFAVYLLAILKTWMNFIWAATFSTSQLMGNPDHKRYLRFFLFVIVLYTVFFNHTFSQNDSLQMWIGKASLFISYLFPICLYGYVLVYERFRRSYIT